MCVCVVFQEVASILASRDQQITTLQERVENLEDQLTDVKESMSNGLGLLMPMPAKRRNPPQQAPPPPAPASPAAAAKTDATKEPSPIKAAGAVPQPEKRGGGGLGKALWSLFGGSSNDNKTNDRSGSPLARVAEQDAAQVTAVVSPTIGNGNGAAAVVEGNGYHGNGNGSNGNGNGVHAVSLVQ